MNPALEAFQDKTLGPCLKREQASKTARPVACSKAGQSLKNAGQHCDERPDFALTISIGRNLTPALNNGLNFRKFKRLLTPSPHASLRGRANRKWCGCQVALISSRDSGLVDFCCGLQTRAASKLCAFSENVFQISTAECPVPIPLFPNKMFGALSILRPQVKLAS
jgi:hypothetical protein